MERDWFDWASLVFNTLATTGGLVGLFVAIRAYKVAKGQGRRTSEVEILRELLLLDEKPGFRESFRESPAEAFHAHGIHERLAALPLDELPTWKSLRFALSLPSVNAVDKPATCVDARMANEHPEVYVAVKLSSAMTREALTAIRRRTE